MRPRRGSPEGGCKLNKKREAWDRMQGTCLWDEKKTRLKGLVQSQGHENHYLKKVSLWAHEYVTFFPCDSTGPAALRQPCAAAPTFGASTHDNAPSSLTGVFREQTGGA